MTQTYLITGVSRGIGLEFARQLSARGDTVIGTVRDPAGNAQAAKVVSRLLVLEAADPSGIESLPAQLGGTPIDVLINNAGVSSDAKSLRDCSADELQRVFMINSVAPMLVARACLPNLLASRRRVLVNVSSQLASIANNTGGSSYPYRASKAALNMLSRCIANEFAAERLTCVALHPGWVRTDMGGPGAPLTADKAVAAMMRLIDRLEPSDSGRFLSFDGAILPW